MISASLTMARHANFLRGFGFNHEYLGSF